MCYHGVSLLFPFMLKILYILLLSSVVSTAYAFDVSIHARNSLQIVFGESYHEVNKLSDYDFQTYITAFEFVLTNSDELYMGEWATADLTVSGKITIVAKTQEANMVCKSFIHSLRIKDKVFEGQGLGCSINGQWVVKRL
jgi:hypothetical protein